LISRQSDVAAHQRGTATEAESLERKGNIFDVFAEPGDEVGRAGILVFPGLMSFSRPGNLS
jgi:hypothetical protein